MKIHHVGYLTKKLENSRKRFYALGFTDEKSAMYDEIRDINISFLRNGAYRVELIEPASCSKDIQTPHTIFVMRWRISILKSKSLRAQAIIYCMRRKKLRV